MIKRIEPLPPRDNKEERQKEIERIFNLEIDQGAEFTTHSISVWKVLFYKYVKAQDSTRKFTFRKQNNNIHKVWRIL